MHCGRCGGVLIEVRETVPYVGPGPCVVDLENVSALTCRACRRNNLQLPERRALDLLIRTLHTESAQGTYRLAFLSNRWRIVAMTQGLGETKLS